MVQFYQFQPTLTIMTLTVKEAESKVIIAARPRGLAGQILHALGIGSNHKLSMSPAGFRLNTETLFGTTRVYCPKEHVAATVYMLQKPIIWLILGVVLAIPTFGIATLIGLLIYYFSKERVMIGIVSDGGTGESLKLEATPEQKEKLDRVRKVMETLVGADKADSGGEHEELTDGSEEDAVASKPLPPPKPKSALGENSTVSCPNCRSQLRVPPSMKGRTVSCPSCKQTFQV